MTVRSPSDLEMEAAELRRRVAELEAARDVAEADPGRGGDRCSAGSCASARELESFAYAISHDLRAPLRAIDGYSRILREDFDGRVEPEMGRLLDRIGHASRRLGCMLDALLAYSRVGRQTLRIQPVAVSDVAREVGEELLCPEMERRGVTIDVGPLPVCLADPGLMKLIFANLVGNAVKFTGRVENAVIEVRCVEHAEDLVFSVKDNGVGFDMRYSNKLFGIFQRLHHEKEFPGVGAGLALVQRALSRMGGRVWAEAEPAVGAVFSFSLAKCAIERCWNHGGNVECVDTRG